MTCGVLLFNLEVQACVSKSQCEEIPPDLSAITLCVQASQVSLRAINWLDESKQLPDRPGVANNRRAGNGVQMVKRV